MKIALTIENVIKDLRELVESYGGSIELGGDELGLDYKSDMEVVARSHHIYEVEVGFGEHYRALVAIGGIKSTDDGVVEAGLCFATLWYSPDLELITADFSKTMP